MEVPTFQDAIRKRPAMYIGSVNLAGFVRLLRRIAGVPSGFEGLFVDARLNRLTLTGKRTGVISVADLEPIALALNDPRRIDDWAYRGFGYLAQLADSCELKLLDNNERVLICQEYREGLSNNEMPLAGELSPTRMELTFTFDDSIWGDMELNPHALSEVYRELAFLFPRKRFELEFDVDSEPCRFLYQFPTGFRTWSNSRTAKVGSWEAMRRQ
jgi:DNA gyrase/topoisomerase IV subunit B